MNRTKEEMTVMKSEKINSKKIVDRLITDELLKMGFSYNRMGTHYLHDSIAFSVSMRLEDFYSINEFCSKIETEICKKYGSERRGYWAGIDRAIETAFQTGNIDYLMDTFKSSYNYERMKVTKNAFIMTVRRKIMEELENQNSYNVTQLRIIIQGELEGISDVPVLEGIRNILFSIKGEEVTINQLLTS